MTINTPGGALTPTRSCSTLERAIILYCLCMQLHPRKKNTPFRLITAAPTPRAFLAVMMQCFRGLMIFLA
jgi:hypothetical protein